MMTRRSLFLGVVWALVLFVSLGVRPVLAADEGSIGGTVLDSLGASVSGAQVVLFRGGAASELKQTRSDSRGEYMFDGLASDRYQVEVRAEGFSTRRTDAVFVGASGRVLVNVSLQIGPLAQELTVTAAASEVPTSQIGAQVTVLDSATIDALGKADVLEALRLVPGAQVIQTGARGGSTSLFVRGGNSNFNKVLIDGVPANDIGGGFDFATVSTTGVDRIEMLRETNSMLFGTDTLAGVVNITTKRGRTRTPELGLSVDGGNLGTVHSGLSIGGTVRRFDYFSEYAYFKTD